MFLSKNGLCFLVLITEPLIDHQIADYVSADMTELYKNMQLHTTTYAAISAITVSMNRLLYYNY